LRISNVGRHHIFDPNQHAHAVSFVGVHVFAAGVILGAFACSSPLSRWSLEAKKGLGRVIQMQRRLEKKVVVSAQSLTLLEKLANDVTSVEAKCMLGWEFGSWCGHYDCLSELKPCQKTHPSQSRGPISRGQVPDEGSDPRLHGDMTLNSFEDNYTLAPSMFNDTSAMNGDTHFDPLLGRGSSMEEADTRALIPKF